MSEHRDFLAPREVAERVGVSYHAVLRAIDRGDLEAFEMVPGRLRIAVDEYDRWTRAAPARGRDERGTAARPRRRARRRQADAGSFGAELKAIEENAA